MKIILLLSLLFNVIFIEGKARENFVQHLSSKFPTTVRVISWNMGGHAKNINEEAWSNFLMYQQYDDKVSLKRMFLKIKLEINDQL